MGHAEREWFFGPCSFPLTTGASPVRPFRDDTMFVDAGAPRRTLRLPLGGQHWRRVAYATNCDFISLLIRVQRGILSVRWPTRSLSLVCRRRTGERGIGVDALPGDSPRVLRACRRSRGSLRHRPRRGRPVLLRPPPLLAAQRIENGRSSRGSDAGRRVSGRRWPRVVGPRRVSRARVAPHRPRTIRRSAIAGRRPPVVPRSASQQRNRPLDPGPVGGAPRRRVARATTDDWGVPGDPTAEALARGTPPGRALWIHFSSHRSALALDREGVWRKHCVHVWSARLDERGAQSVGEVAQLVEHRIENAGVGGSSPPLAIARRIGKGRRRHRGRGQRRATWRVDATRPEESETTSAKRA
jgi:hypothetical protein